jgi:hypothetical protein
MLGLKQVIEEQITKKLKLMIFLIKVLLVNQ